MPTAPLDTLETVVNVARVRLLDAIPTISGNILTDADAATLVNINAAWRRFQELLVNFGYTWLKLEKVLAAVAAVTSTDTSSQVYVNWANYFDGTSPQSAPVLPQDLIAPLVLWERATGGTNSFMPMDRMDNGLPAVPKGLRNKCWEFRNGAIYLPGSTVIVDLRLRYAASCADFVDAGTTPFASQTVPILRSVNPFAWFICAEAAKARGDLDAGDFEQKAQLATKFMFDLDTTQGKSILNEAEYAKMTDRYTPPQGPQSERGQGGQ